MRSLRAASARQLASQGESRVRGIRVDTSVAVAVRACCASRASKSVGHMRHEPPAAVLGHGATHRGVAAIGRGAAIQALAAAVWMGPTTPLGRRRGKAGPQERLRHRTDIGRHGVSTSTHLLHVQDRCNGSPRRHTSSAPHSPSAARLTLPTGPLFVTHDPLYSGRQVRAPCGRAGRTQSRARPPPERTLATQHACAWQWRPEGRRADMAGGMSLCTRCLAPRLGRRSRQQPIDDGVLWEGKDDDHRGDHPLCRCGEGCKREGGLHTPPLVAFGSGGASGGASNLPGSRSGRPWQLSTMCRDWRNR